MQQMASTLAWVLGAIIVIINIIVVIVIGGTVVLVVVVVRQLIGDFLPENYGGFICPTSRDL